MFWVGSVASQSTSAGITMAKITTSEQGILLQVWVFLWQEPGFTQWAFVGILTLQMALGHWSRIFPCCGGKKQHVLHSKHVAPSAG